MSGGFFRGTSADQDTRFSNKEAKLLKSKKFAPGLDILVDMTKVKMDVMRPWIAQRVTEMLGFEDEVLINFIFGLLDGKDVDGKQIQIQLTGFMEKNTGKFMKELWSLLISAQNNISGVPQQFLDAKEEETRKKKAETDRINWEIQQKREKDSREMVQEHKKKLDGETHSPQDAVLALDASSKDLLPKTQTGDNNIDKHKLQGRERFATPPSVDEQSHSPRRNYRNSRRRRSRSFSKTRSSSRSPSSIERNRSRSISRSPERIRHSPIGRGSYSPVQSPDHKRSRYAQSPLRRRSPYLRRRSPSPIRHRPPTPVRRRSPSPWHRKSPAVVRRRSPSPRRRSPSPIRRRPSPVRRKSPSPRGRSPSPYRRRSPRYHRRSPIRSPRRRRAEVSTYERNRGRSPYRSHSPPKRDHRSLSEGPGSRAYGSELRHLDEEKNHRMSSRRSPDRYALNKDNSEYSGGCSNAPESSMRPPSTTLRSPQRDVKHKSDDSHKMLKSTHYEEPLHGQSELPVHVQSRNLNEERGKNSSGRTVDLKRPSKLSPKVHGRNGPLRKNDDKEYSPAAIASNTSPGHEYISEPIKNDDNLRSIDAYPLEEFPKKRAQLSSRNSEEIEYEPGRPEDDASWDRRTVRQASSRRHIKDDDDEGRFAGADMVSRKSRLDEKMKLGYEDSDLGKKKEAVKGSLKKVEHGCHEDVGDESDGEGEENKNARYFKDHKKQKREESERDDGDGDHDISGSDERKESKRRRKEEKKKRKEERRRKREERHRRREEQQEMKAKSVVSGSSDYGKNHNVVDRSDGDDARGSSYQSDADEEESEQKRLEIELRKKALESLRAKKAIY